MTETLTPLVKGLHAEYVPAKWDGKDTSGVRVVGKTVLVLMDEVAEVRDSGIELPIDYRERMNASCETGVLVSVSPGAFLLNEDMTPWYGAKPKAGDRVYIEKYAGKQVKGRDGKIYRLMDYGSIGATYEPGPKAKPTIDELEAILNSEDDRPVIVNPDGSISAAGAN
jgi:chaperonin GroES